MELIILDASSIEKLYEIKDCCVVGFSKTNCHVCQAVMPALEEVATKYEGRAKFFRVDVEANRDLYSRFSLKGVPTILFFKGGEYEGKMAGLVNEEQIEQKIEQLLQLSPAVSNA
jgi:thioredoxin 1